MSSAEAGEPTLHHLSVPRSARYALLGAPGPGVSELWMVLHGYRQLAHRFIRRFGGLASPARLVAAPEALNRFYVEDAPGRHGPASRVGGTWMTREDREAEIRDYVGYLDRLHNHLQGDLPAPAPTVVLGFSQGCHTAARWTAYGAVRPRAVILWGEVLPGDLDMDRAGAAWEGVRLVSVQGREDAHITPELMGAQEEQAGRAGVALEVRWHEGGHGLDRELLLELARELAAS